MRIISIILLLVSINGIAKDFTPNKPVQVIIPNAQGSAVDITFRQIQKYALQQNINLIGIYRPGADSIIGLNKLVNSSTDGYTIGITVISAVAYHRVKEPEQSSQIGIITNVKTSINSVITHNNTKLTSIKQVIREMNNGKIMKMGVSGTGSRLGTEQLLSLINSKTESIIVPYFGTGNVLNALMGEHIEVSVMPFLASQPFIDSNRIKLLMLTSRVKFDNYKTDYVYDIFPQWENYEGHLILINKNADKNSTKFWNDFFKQYQESDIIKSYNLKELNYDNKFGDIKSIDQLIHTIMKKI
jgi:tripartite-type tricarboxylate transporter receptor subunit TctC